MGPVLAEWGRVGQSRAEWGWGGVGHALGFNYITPKIGQVRPARAEWGRVGPGGGRLGLSGVLGMHWDSIKLLVDQWGRVGPVRAEWGQVGPSRAG